MTDDRNDVARAQHLKEIAQRLRATLAEHHEASARKPEVLKAWEGANEGLDRAVAICDAVIANPGRRNTTQVIQVATEILTIAYGQTDHLITELLRLKSPLTPQELPGGEFLEPLIERVVHNPAGDDELVMSPEFSAETPYLQLGGRLYGCKGKRCFCSEQWWLDAPVRITSAGIFFVAGALFASAFRRRPIPATDDLIDLWPSSSGGATRSSVWSEIVLGR